MDAFLNSFFLVFASEMGDKTQLLALLLVARFKKPWTILGGVCVATILNHALAAWIGGVASDLFSHETLKALLAITFIGFGIWILIPDKEEEFKNPGTLGAFATAVVAFFLAEMGDKTQLATVALGARYHLPVAVTLGSSLGMVGANAIAIFLGDKILKRIPMKWIRLGACLLFIIFGFAIYFGF